MKKNESIKRSYTYSEFLLLLQYCTDDHQKELLGRLKEAKRPDTIGGKEVPESLNLVSYGLLDDLSNISKTNTKNPIIEAISMVTGATEESICSENVFDVFGVANWIGKELERINKLFASISPKYSAEEIAAGVKNLNFGSFGILDWYSHRQGISDQNEVRNVAWVRIYTCMKNDNAKAEYEKRLNRQYQQKYKSHGKRT